MKINNKSTKIMGAVSGAAVTTALFTTSVFASPATLSRANTHAWKHDNATSTSAISTTSRPVLFGNVASIDGSTLTINRLRFSRDGSGTTTASYTVNAANATILKSGATTTVASIVLGDRILVQGAMSGSVVTATTIRDLGANATSSDKKLNKHTPTLNAINRGKHFGWNNTQKHTTSPATVTAR